MWREVHYLPLRIMYFRREDYQNEIANKKQGKKLFSAKMRTKKLEEHNMNTQINETQGTLCMIDQIIK